MPRLSVPVLRTAISKSSALWFCATKVGDFGFNVTILFLGGMPRTMDAGSDSDALFRLIRSGNDR